MKLVPASQRISIKSKINIFDFAATIGIKFSESIGDMVVTVAITGITLFYMLSIIPLIYANTIPGLYIAAMIVQLLIRIVRRFDESATPDELKDQMSRFEASINERLDIITRNV